MQFNFGKNWLNFSRSALTSDKIAQAQDDFARLFDGIELQIKRNYSPKNIVIPVKTGIQSEKVILQINESDDAIAYTPYACFFEKTLDI